jgi:hypothetical protein
VTLTTPFRLSVAPLRRCMAPVISPRPHWSSAQWLVPLLASSAASPMGGLWPPTSARRPTIDGRKGDERGSDEMGARRLRRMAAGDFDAVERMLDPAVTWRWFEPGSGIATTVRAS